MHLLSAAVMPANATHCLKSNDWNTCQILLKSLGSTSWLTLFRSQPSSTSLHSTWWSAVSGVIKACPGLQLSWLIQTWSRCSSKAMILSVKKRERHIKGKRLFVACARHVSLTFVLCHPTHVLQASMQPWGQPCIMPICSMLKIKGCHTHGAPTGIVHSTLLKHTVSVVQPIDQLIIGHL